MCDCVPVLLIAKLYIASFVREVEWLFKFPSDFIKFTLEITFGLMVLIYKLAARKNCNHLKRVSVYF